MMAGLADVLRLLIEKSWALGVLLLVTGGGAWLLSQHGQHVPAIIDEWSPLTTLAGLALIILSFVSAVLERASAALARRAQAKRDAEEALANLAALDPEEMAQLAEALEAGVTRMTIDAGSVMSRVLGKGLLRMKRKQSALWYICDIHPAIVGVRDEIIAQWRKDQQEGRVPSHVDQRTSWTGR